MIVSAIPCIPYELTDRFTSPHATSADGWPRASIEGRADDTFRYGGVAVHPHVIRSVLSSVGAVHEYQVRQTQDGVDIDCVTGGRLDTAVLKARLADSLRQAGLTQPEVSITVAEAIPRDPRTGKARRFIPRQR
jgi:phenylacetate-coenzyme A ligase PaaK-like adenylate-forming protein